MGKNTDIRAIIIYVFIIFICTVNQSNARDTDIYDISTKQNCYILMDNSGSMDFGVYEYTVDYGKMFDYLYCLDADGGDTACGNTYIYDTVNHSSYFYNNHKERRKIFLWKAENKDESGKSIGITIANVDGQDMAFAGDAADPEFLWYSGSLVDTHTMIDEDGNLSDDDTTDGIDPRITVDSDGYVLLDGDRLPIGQDIKLHEFKKLYDGSVVDNGFGGMLNAPGYYFSGYKGVTQGSLDIAEDGDSGIYFFLTGNWANMQAVYNLHYVTNNPVPTGARQGDPAWKYETVPVDVTDWSELSHTLDYPEGSGNYENKLSESDTTKTIVHPGAQQMQVHFSSFDVKGGNDKDYVVLKNGNGTDIIKYDNDNIPSDGWSETVTGDSVTICLDSDNGGNAAGYTIDKIRLTYQKDTYLMQTRLDVAKDAMLYTLDEFYGKMNWGFATFKSGDGATLNYPLNPNETDDVNTNAVKNAVENVSAGGGTPLGEALQDVFEQGYYKKRHSLDNLNCRKNYIISLSDGFPSQDDDWSRTTNKVFSDEDHDGWTQDPYQYSNPSPDYYDDVAHWIYTHSWQDDNNAEVADPANSYENVITHHIAFGAKQPLMMDAAGESGGEYVTAYNKSQLVAAFYALSLMITDAVSFTSPVVSVNAANKIQNGDDLYLGLFLPQDNQMWVGNIKKFRFGNKAGEDPWMIYDGAGNPAVNSEGEFFDNAAAFWADDNDANDSDNYGAADVKEDGVGEVLQERVEDDFSTKNYYERNIRTYDPDSDLSNNLVSIDNLDKDDLGVLDLSARNSLINYLYGYTNEADATTGNPLATRDWVLGAIIHSRPLVIDYYNADNTLSKRYIAVGANDGMLHVFNDENGKEELAFIPADMLTKLQNLPIENFVDTVDGRISLFRKDNNPKYLIFGERRSGGKYWCLNIADPSPSNWHVAWVYDNPEISQSWAEPKFARIPTGIDENTGAPSFQEVMIVTGGYDAEEDNYPEPFVDGNHNGYPDFNLKEWSKNDATQDINDNDEYDLYNTDKDENGRGIFVVDIDNPATEVFSVSYDSAGTDIEKNMKWCFPATPSVITKTYTYTAKGSTTQTHITNVLQSIYAIDVYANLYKINFDFDVNYDESSKKFSLQKSWGVKKIFSGNPTSTGNAVTSDGEFTKGSDDINFGLKTFYSPAVSLGGACQYFDAGNYNFTDTTFKGTTEIASIYFGTGDREHPTYAMKKNRFYAVYDDSSIQAVDKSGNSITVSTIPYKEADLLNLSCDELDDDTTLSGSPGKDEYRKALRDDPYYYDNSGALQLENGTNENDAKGWYIVLEDQGVSSQCAHCTYPSGYASDIHLWEKVLSRVQLFAGILYFTTYQPDMTDICNPNGNGFSYSLDYCDASSAYDLDSSNNDSSSDDPSKQSVTDRFNKVNNIFGIPSGSAIVIRNGKGSAMSMMGGKMVGAKGGKEYEIKSPGLGLDLYYWLEGTTIK